MNAATPAELTRVEISALLPPRPVASNKGENGRALLCVGSESYTGAALLSSAAALRAGCGILFAAVPARVKPAFCALPEAVCLPVGAGGDWDKSALDGALALLSGKNALCVGCGMGNMADARLLAAVLETGLPLVLDADALNFMAARREWLGRLHPKVILTPHAGEMARLTGLSMQQIKADTADVARAYADEWNCVVLLKDAVSMIAEKDRRRVNTAGNAGLAKGGSGDVLAGLVTGLLAQGLAPFDAACAGAFLLGSSADTALELLGNRMLMATDVLSAVAGTLHALAR